MSAYPPAIKPRFVIFPIVALVGIFCPVVIVILKYKSALQADPPVWFVALFSVITCRHLLLASCACVRVAGAWPSPLCRLNHTAKTCCFFSRGTVTRSTAPHVQ